MGKQKRLRQVREKLEADAPKLPLAKTAQDTVPGEGNPYAEIMFIGEAAGYHELVKRRPFVGAAGKLLTQSLTDIGIPRKRVYISNVLKVRPPENRDPLPEEIEAFRPYLDTEINIIKPKIIATLGRFSMGKFIADAKISRVHGQPRWVDFKEQRVLILPLYHPAAALRSSFIMRQFQSDFAKIPRLLKIVKEPAKSESRSKTTAGAPPQNKPSQKNSEEQHQLSLI